MILNKLIRRKLIVLFILAVVFGSHNQVVQADSTVVVQPSDVGVDWFEADTRAGGNITFVSGPGAPPIGTGSLEMSTTDSLGSSQAKAQFVTGNYIDTLLVDVTHLSYATYRSSTSTNPTTQYPGINIGVDYLGNGSSFTTLVWEPTYAYTALLEDTWQTWDTLAASQTGFDGGWWSTRTIAGIICSPIQGGCSGEPIYVSWNYIVTQLPSAQISGIFGVNVGSGWTNEFVGNVDAIKVGINSDTTTYDFEPTPPDEQGPVTSNVLVDPNPVEVNTQVLLTADVDDSTTGGSDVASAEYSFDGGPWTLMNAVNGSFDEVAEDVSAGFTVPDEAGIYDLCVRGTDEHGNVGETECVMVVVYDPDGGFVTGGGWIDSPLGAIPSDASLSGALVAEPWGGIVTRDTTVVCDPNNSPVTVSGWVDVSDVPNNGALLVGLIDKQWVDDGNDGFFTGAYAYIARSGTTLRVGPSDGNAGGELNSVRANVTVDPWVDVVVNFSMVIFNGQVTVTYEGTDYTDTYGDVPSSFTWDEFEFGAYPGADLWAPGGNADYHVTVEGCEGGPTGKANFGFVAKYKKGANVPIGNTEFVFKAGDLNFHSTSYDWLVVTGNDTAKFKGEGTINGDNSVTGDPYKFQIWAQDDSPDTFCIKIWYEDNGSETVVYDNGMDQPIGGGNIVVHSK